MTAPAPAPKRPQGRPATLTPKQIVEATRLRREGRSWREIGRLMEVPYVTAWRSCPPDA